ncbi:BspA family leucine-rich repeat surface protein [Enterococcus nangangensis]|uniref:BspA family leucine-rich repeat surface protein n=1 Tax=Enterococcus nangangensis TaxID=2559926 RepID=UPI0010F4C1C6|nr:BspA family leucine-rich repeat surface protein [Enterococcus nangangensis]
MEKSKRGIGIIVSVICLVLVLFLIPKQTHSEESILDQGNYGIDWRLTTDGVLYLEAGTLLSPEGPSYDLTYPWSKNISNIRKVVIEGKVVLPKTPKLFTKMTRLKTIDNIELLDTSRVEDMSYMFYDVTEIDTLDLSSWDTSNVTDMSGMFKETYKLKDLFIANWNVSKVTNMSNMFYDATGLTSLNLNFWDVSNVKDMSGMFSVGNLTLTSNLKELNIDAWNVKNVQNMNYMFLGSAISSLDLSNWNVSNVTAMSGMFEEVFNLPSLDLSKWNTSKVINMTNMFRRIKNLNNLNLSGWNVALVQNMYFMFGETYFEVLNLSDWILSGITDIEGLFDTSEYNYGGVSSTNLNLSNWDIDKLYTLDSIKNIKNMSNLKISNWKDSEKLEDTLNALFLKFPELKIEGAGYQEKAVSDLSFEKINSIMYTGNKIEPNIEVYDGKDKLEKNVDYTITFGENILNYGSVTISGTETYNNKRKYVGTKEITFKILPAKSYLVNLPLASSIYKGQSLSASNISNGKVVDNSGKEIQGNFKWKELEFANIELNETGFHEVEFSATGYETLSFHIEVKVLVGWTKIDNKWYYYGEYGKNTDWIQVKSKWYYMDSLGVMQTGWQLIRWCSSDPLNPIVDYWYYFNDSGAMQIGWQKIEDKWYYLDNGGVMQMGWQHIGNTWYYLDASGAMQTGWQHIGNTWYYLNTSGAMQMGWQHIGNTWYYLNASGAMQTGWQHIGNTWYYLSASGSMQIGWLQTSGKWYYLDSSGSMITGTKKIGNTIYKFNSSGVWIK